MRFTPLLSSLSDPLPWRDFPAVELVWQGGSPQPWLQGAPVHAIHLDGPLEDAAQAGPALQALLSLGADFLVVPALLPADLLAQSRLLGTLEVLLEALGGRGPRLVLRPGKHAEALAALLREARGEAIGFCWDAQVPDIQALEDRLLCAVAEPEDDLTPLLARGFRWNVAVSAQTPGEIQAQCALLQTRYPDPLFPRLLPNLPPVPGARP